MKTKLLCQLYNHIATKFEDMNDMVKRHGPKDSPKQLQNYDAPLEKKMTIFISTCERGDSG